jgi:uncharacterized protein with HEPN domain
MLNKDFYILLSIQDTLEKIIKYSSAYSNAEDFYENDRDFDATMMNLIVLGEEAGKLSDEFKLRNEYINWSKVYGLRNIIAHHYFGINGDLIWQIIENDIPKLREQIKPIINQ